MVLSVHSVLITGHSSSEENPSMLKMDELKIDFA
jgi:hypothetical protein